VALNLGPDPVQVSISREPLSGHALASTTNDRAHEIIRGAIYLRSNEESSSLD
jgi:hypothetical protein